MEITASARRRTASALLLLLAVCGIALSACGGSGSSSSSGGSTSPADSGGEPSETAPATASDPNLKKAEEGIAEYLGHPSPMVVKQPLKTLPKPGETVIFLNCGNAECQGYWPGFEAAAKALGYVPKQVNSGLTPATVGPAVASAVQQHPAGIFDPGLDPFLFKGSEKAIEEAGIPVVANAIPEPVGGIIQGELADAANVENAGKMLADYLYTQAGEEAAPVFVDVNEIQLSSVMFKGFEKELKALCPACDVNQLTVGIASIGSSLPAEEVSYLQKSPDVNWLVNFAGGFYIGVPQALKGAGLEVDSLAQSGGPVNMEYLKDGLETANLTFDYHQVGWMAMDMIARLDTGQEIPPEEQGEYVPGQFLTQEDITFDPEEGFVAYPEYEATYEKLWGVSH